MQGFVKREQLLSRLKILLKNYPAVALLGARQVGKSTLAKHILALWKKPVVYLDLQLPKDLNKLSDPTAFFEFHHKSLICLDEIQYKPDLFKILRGLIDQKKEMDNF